MTLMSRVHLEGGESVPVMDAVESVLKQWLGVAPHDGLMCLRGDGALPVLIPIARVVWVSTIPQPAADAAPVERGGSGL